MIALIVLQALDYALDKWETLAAESGYPVAEEHWHVNEYYKSIREKAVNVPGCWGNSWKIGQGRHLSEIEAADDEDSDGHRNLDGEDFWPARLCNLPLQGRTLWGPRHNPMETSLLTIMKPNPMGDIDPNIKKAAYMTKPCYNPPDRPAHWTVPPASEPFAPLIGASRRLTVDEEHDKRQLRSRLDGSPSPEEVREIVSIAEEGDKVPIFRSNISKNTTRVLAEGDAVENIATTAVVD